jgi:hypothetical protein
VALCGRVVSLALQAAQDYFCRRKNGKRSRNYNSSVPFHPTYTRAWTLVSTRRRSFVDIQVVDIQIVYIQVDDIQVVNVQVVDIQVVDIQVVNIQVADIQVVNILVVNNQVVDILVVDNQVVDIQVADINPILT